MNKWSRLDIAFVDGRRLTTVIWDASRLHQKRVLLPTHSTTSGETVSTPDVTWTLPRYVGQTMPIS